MIKALHERKDCFSNRYLICSFASLADFRFPSYLIACLAEGFIYISTFLAIHNMAQKMPSFQSGGILWFTDLTTPDRFYILPVVTGLTFCFATIPLSRQENSAARRSMRLLCWISASVAFQATFSIESAVYCFMISSRVAIHGIDLAMVKSPKVRELLGLPDVFALYAASKASCEEMRPELLKLKQKIQSRTEKQKGKK
ncbi:PREDICTED: mitochondrial inner membrane protein OXA1-like [Tarenaya hassleriana]|uniref:mitochondrial inner membrane protein OXA1-like n=1 Tax=Tarenaya hassleriana TaxID=28532 RepID=UPI00053C5931|nr:PREDICTED: mitochondrial inner membrane protein OXA1-like [Tarenaya hassleriana]